MTTYRVFEVKNTSPDVVATGENMRVIKDGFCIFALAFPPLYLFWHRLWFALITYIGLIIIVIALAQFLNPVFVLILNALLGLYLGFEGTNLRADKLLYQGWEEVDVVIAGSTEEAEGRALLQKRERIDRLTASAPVTPAASTPASGYRMPASQVIGSFSNRPRSSGLPS